MHKRLQTTDTEEGLKRPKCPDRNVLLPMLILTIDQSKDTGKYIVDDEAVWSNIVNLV